MEDLHFQYCHHKFFAHIINQELYWLYAMTPDKGMYFLGKFIEGRLFKSDLMKTLGFPLYHGATKLFKNAEEHYLLDGKLRGVYTNPMSTKKLTYTRKDFVKWGKLGAKKVVEKYGKSGAEIRWDRLKNKAKKELSPTKGKKSLQTDSGGITM